MKTKIYVEDLLPVQDALPLITDEWIEEDKYCQDTVTTLRDALQEAQTKLSERKTVHEWLNACGIAREENGKPICLLRRLRIACNHLYKMSIHEDEVEAVATFLRIRRGIAEI